MCASKREYQIGDLVKCIYDLFDHYEYFWDQIPTGGYPFHGIIVDIHDNVINEEKLPKLPKKLEIKKKIFKLKEAQFINNKCSCILSNYYKCFHKNFNIIYEYEDNE